MFYFSVIFQLFNYTEIVEQLSGNMFAFYSVIPKISIPCDTQGGFLPYLTIGETGDSRSTEKLQINRFIQHILGNGQIQILSAAGRQWVDCVKNILTEIQ